MSPDEPAGLKFKHVCTDLQNFAVLTKISTPGDIQVTYMHESVRKSPFGKTVTTFDPEGSLKLPTKHKHETENAPEESDVDEDSRPDKDNDQKNRRQDPQSTRRRATQRSELQPTATTSSRSFRRSLSKYHKCWWHQSCYKQISAQPDGCASGWTAT